MRLLLLAASALALAACQPPAQQQAPGETPQAEAPAQTACNNVQPNLSQAISVEGDVAAAAAVADLRGGRVGPGLYDLARANRFGAATGWSGQRAVSLEVLETDAGTTFNWASAPQVGGDAERWTAGFIDGPTPHLTYTCGKTGGAEVEFTAEPNGINLRLPDDTGAGSLLLTFVRRA